MGKRGRQPQVGLGLRNCANAECGQQFQPYRENQYTCSRGCYNQLPEIKERNNAARRTQEHRDRKNEWRRTSPAQQARMYQYNRVRNLARFGLTIEDYDRMLAEQNGVCMLCGRPPKPEGIKAESKLHADHDHATGQHRDLLCSNCNKGLGCFGDDPALLRVAADYIERHRSVAV